MTLFLATFVTLLIVMLALGMNLVIGRTNELKRGCGDDCECLREKQALPATRIAQNEVTRR